MKLYLVEGKDEIHLLLGVLGRTDSTDIRNMESMARKDMTECSKGCYKLGTGIILKDGGGKDNMRKVIKDLREEDFNCNYKIVALVDGDARGMNLDDADMVFHLSHQNLDELIYDFVVKESLTSIQDPNESGVFHELRNIIDKSGDSKEKELFAELLAKRYLMRDKRWEDKSTFLKILGSEFGDKILGNDQGLRNFAKCLLWELKQAGRV